MDWVKATLAGRFLDIVVFASGKNSSMRLPMRMAGELKSEVEATLALLEEMKGTIK